MLKKPLILIGGGGHCKSCIDVIESANEWEIIGILDGNMKPGDNVLNYSVVGDDSDIDKLIKNDYFFFIAVGQIKSATIRENIFNNLKLKSARIATIVSANAVVSKHANIGEGTMIHHACVVNAGAHIGENNIINTGAIIEHDASIGNNNHISTNSTVNGDVKIGNGCFIGSGAVISNKISITNNVILGAGSVVLKDIVQAGIYAGCPAKILGGK
ncbi:MAG: acetyltransferase [Mucilaginibacter sp.]